MNCIARALLVVTCLAAATAAHGGAIANDQEAIDCALGLPGSEYAGGEVDLHLAAARIWATCLSNHSETLRARFQAQLKALPESDARTRAVWKQGLRLAEKHVFIAALVVTSVDELAIESDLRKRAQLLRVVHKASFRSQTFWLRSYREIYEHAAQASILFRAEVEQRFASRLAEFAAIPGVENTKFAEKAVKRALLAEEVSAALDELLPLLATDFSNVVEPGTVSLTREQIQAIKVRSRDLQRGINRFHRGVKALLALTVNLEKLAQKAARAVVEIEGSKKIKLREIPNAQPNPGGVGQQLTFRVTAEFPGEEWLAIAWDFGDGTSLPFEFFFQPGEITDIVAKTYAAPGSYPVTCTIFHGYKSGTFGVGPPRFERTVRFTVEVQ